MALSSWTEALLTWSWGYRPAPKSARADAWSGSLVVGGGEVSWGVGGEGVRIAARAAGACEDEGGGVMDDVVRGVGEASLEVPGDAGWC